MLVWHQVCVPQSFGHSSLCTPVHTPQTMHPSLNNTVCAPQFPNANYSLRFSYTKPGGKRFCPQNVRMLTLFSTRLTCASTQDANVTLRHRKTPSNSTCELFLSDKFPDQLQAWASQFIQVVVLFYVYSELDHKTEFGMILVKGTH